MVLNNFIKRRFTTKNSTVNRSVSATADERVCMQIYVNTGLYRLYFCLAVRPSHELHVQSSDFYSVPDSIVMSAYVCLSVQYVCLRLCVCLFFMLVRCIMKIMLISTTTVHRCIRLCTVMLVS